MVIRQYLAIILRRWWIVVVGVVVGSLLAFLVSISSQPIYGASARLLIDQPPGSQVSNEYNQFLLEQRQALTYAEIVKMRSVLEEAIGLLNLPFTDDELGDMITVSTLRDTQIIEIQVEDTEPARAVAIANTIGTVFIDQNQERESLRFSEPIATGQARLETISAEQSKLEEMLADAELDEIERVQIEAQLAELESRYNNTLENLGVLLAEQALPRSNVVLLEEAEIDDTPLRPRVLRTTLLAGIVGGLVGLIIVFLLDYMDDTVNNPAQVEHDTGFPVVGSIATIKGDDNGISLVAHADPRHPISDAYRTLRTNLQFAAANGRLSSVLITSPSPNEGKSTTVANLAVVLAQQGNKVIVVDADLRRPTQHEIFKVDQHLGLTSALIDQETPVTDYLCQSHISNLSILPSGSLPPNPVDLLGASRMKAILETLSNNADVLIFDTPPILSVADTAILAQYTDITLLVALFEKTKKAALTASVKQLETSKVRLYGIVINMLAVGRGYYYQQYYERREA